MTAESVIDIKNGRLGHQSTFWILYMVLSSIWHTILSEFTSYGSNKLFLFVADMFCRKWPWIHLFPMIRRFWMMVLSFKFSWVLISLQEGHGRINIIIGCSCDAFTRVIFAGRINIITGPNYSGKSIYIKQVGSYTHSSSSLLGPACSSTFFPQFTPWWILISCICCYLVVSTT